MWPEVIIQRRAKFQDAEYLSDWQVDSAHLVSAAIKFTHTGVEKGPWFVPMPTCVPKRAIETVPLASASISGIPLTSPTEKITPPVRLFAIENNWPALPSQDRVLSSRTFNSIGFDEEPIYCIFGWTVLPASGDIIRLEVLAEPVISMLPVNW